MKFGQLTECNVRNNFAEKSYAKCGGETGSVNLSFIQFVFIVCQVESYQNLLKLSCRLHAFISH